MDRQPTDGGVWLGANPSLLDPGPRYGTYGEIFMRRVRSIGIRDRPTSPRSPWQNAYAERLIGSVRRECIDHIVVFGERHLRHVLLSYMSYYNGTRTHLSLNKGRAGVTGRRDSWTHYLPSNPGRTAPSIWPDLIYGRHREQIPRYLIRDRDGTYGEIFMRRAAFDP